jgi:hypothetical protein
MIDDMLKDIFVKNNSNEINDTISSCLFGENQLNKHLGGSIFDMPLDDEKELEKNSCLNDTINYNLTLVFVKNETCNNQTLLPPEPEVKIIYINNCTNITKIEPPIEVPMNKTFKKSSSSQIQINETCSPKEYAKHHKTVTNHLKKLIMDNQKLKNLMIKYFLKRQKLKLDAKKEKINNPPVFNKDETYK